MPPARYISYEAASTSVLLSTLVLTLAKTGIDQILAILLLYQASQLFHEVRPSIRGPYNASHSEDYLDNLLHVVSPRRFKSFFRVDRASFERLVNLIKDDPVFRSAGKKPQAPVWHQLASFLLRFGCDPTDKTAEQASIAEGTVYLYCRRVIKALRHLRPRFLSWPDAARRTEIKARMEVEGFPGCIGVVDGSLIRLATRPTKDGDLYFCRKKYYSIAVQCVCDDTLRFLEYDLGWPGNVHDTTIFRESSVWRHKAEHFARGEYILADKGYPLTTYTIRPFAESDLLNNGAETQRRRKFNVRLSHCRIAIEHAFGMLKGRFPALRELPGRNLNHMYMAVEALMVLHNILIDLKDNPEDIDMYNGLDDHNIDVAVNADELARIRHREIDAMNDAVLHQGGLHRRRQIMSYMRDNRMI